jgi:hypothetical protein
MATEGVDPLVPEANITYATTPTATTPLLATSMMPVHQRYPVTPWAPRTGRTSVYHQWRRDVGRLLASFSLSWEDVQQDAPIASIAGIRSETSSVATDEALRTAAWQRVNTALYWHVAPSLLLVGPDRVRDERFVDANINKHLAHGRAIIRWACSLADTDSLEQQTKLTADVGAARLKVGSTWSEVDVFVQLLHDKWSRIAINQAAQSLHGFWRQLLVAMPTEPAGSHLTGLRTWLAGHVVGYGQLGPGAAMPKGAPRLHSLDSALNDMKQHAESMGLPSARFDDRTDLLLAYGELLGANGVRDELDAWLMQHDCCLAPGVWGIGDLVGGLGDVLPVTGNSGGDGAGAQAPTECLSGGTCHACSDTPASASGEVAALRAAIAEARAAQRAAEERTANADAVIGGRGAPGGASGEVASLRAAIAEARAAQRAAEERTARASSRTPFAPSSSP